MLTAMWLAQRFQFDNLKQNEICDTKVYFVDKLQNHCSFLLYIFISLAISIRDSFNDRFLAPIARGKRNANVNSI